MHLLYGELNGNVHTRLVRSGLSEAGGSGRSQRGGTPALITGKGITFLANLAILIDY